MDDALGKNDYVNSKIRPMLISYQPTKAIEVKLRIFPVQKNEVLLQIGQIGKQELKITLKSQKYPAHYPMS